MNGTIYKGLKYIVLWSILYIIVKYTTEGELSELDMILVASVLTLLVSVFENMYFTQNTCKINSEHMQSIGQSNKQPVFQQSRQSIQPAHSQVQFQSNQLADQSSSLSDLSSGSSSSSNNSSSSSNSSLTDSVSNARLQASLEDQRRRQLEIINQRKQSSLIPSSKNVQTNGNKFTQPVPKSTNPVTTTIVDENYLGEKVIFDLNEFGGTTTRPVRNGSNSGLGADVIVPSDAVVPSDDSDSSVSSDIVDTNPYDRVNPNQEKRVSFSPDVLTNGLATPSRNVPNRVTNGVNGVNAVSANGITNDIKIKVDLPNSRQNSNRVIRPDSVIVDSDDLGEVANNFTDVPEEYARDEEYTKVSPGGKPLKWYEQAFNPRDYAGAENLDQIAVSNGRTRNDILVNEMIYSDFNRLPPSFNDRDFEYGYSFIPPRDWYPLPVYPPVCVSHNERPISPVYLDTMTMDLKEWHETQKITPPDSINTAFVTNELNSKV